MLGTFYEKVWDLNRQTQSDLHRSTSTAVRGEQHRQKSKRRHSSLQNKMHLSNGDSIVRFSSRQEEPTEVKVLDNGTVEVQGDGHTQDSTEHTQTNGNVPAANEVQIAIPQTSDVGDVLDTMLTAWSILIQRYQRETFHQFTWGVKDAGDEQIQCVSISDVDLQNQKLVVDLKSKISASRSSTIPNDQPVLFLNDGTKDEVRSSTARNHLNVTNMNIVDFRGFHQYPEWLTSSGLAMVTTNNV